MRLNVMQNDDGITTGFEVPNILLSRGRACRIASRVRGARIVRKPSLFRSRDDDFCAFEVDGVPFLIIEPFQDNDVYWIVTETPSANAALLIERVQATFAAAWG